MAEIIIEPGAMRELHVSCCSHPSSISTDHPLILQWHPTQDEWRYFLEGTGRMTLFASSSNAVTFNYEPGDISYIPATYGHYIENTGNTTLKYLEIWNSSASCRSRPGWFVC